jgi:hypothetical protein
MMNIIRVLPPNTSAITSASKRAIASVKKGGSAKPNALLPASTGGREKMSMN